MFNFDSITGVVGGVVIVALVTTMVAHKETANDINAIGSSGTNFLRAAMGH